MFVEVDGIDMGLGFVPLNHLCHHFIIISYPFQFREDIKMQLITNPVWDSQQFHGHFFQLTLF